MPHKAQGHNAQKAAGDTPYVAAVRAWFRARIVLLPPNSPELQKPTKDKQKMYNWQTLNQRALRKLGLWWTMREASWHRKRCL